MQLSVRIYARENIRTENLEQAEILSTTAKSMAMLNSCQIFSGMMGWLWRFSVRIASHILWNWKRLPKQLIAQWCGWTVLNCFLYILRFIQHFCCHRQNLRIRKLKPSTWNLLNDFILWIVNITSIFFWHSGALPWCIVGIHRAV